MHLILRRENFCGSLSVLSIELSRTHDRGDPELARDATKGGGTVTRGSKIRRSIYQSNSFVSERREMPDRGRDASSVVGQDSGHGSGEYWFACKKSPKIFPQCRRGRITLRWVFLKTFQTNRFQISR